MDFGTTRHLPHNTEAEQAVLGAMMRGAEQLEDIKIRLKAQDFHHVQHQLMYEAMLSLVDRQMAVDSTTLTAHLYDYGRLEEIGGAPYILAVFESVTTLAHTEHYVNLVLEKSTARKVIERAQLLIEQGYNPDMPIDQLLEEAKRHFSSLEGDAQNEDFRTLADVLKDYIANLERLSQQTGEITGLHTGFDAFDKKTAGLQNGSLVIVAARPAMGKTVFAINIAVNAARLNRINVAIFNLEMGAEEVVGRILSSEGRIDFSKLKTGTLDADDWRSLKIATDSLSQVGVFLDDTSRKVTQIIAKCRVLHRQQGLGLIVIDYLQLMEGSRGAGGNRQLEISEMSRALKLLARELNVPIVAVAQLSRSVESREDKRPIMSDLRESGSIEQDADIVTFLLREDYYRPPEEPKDNMVEVIFAKHRSGATGSIKLGFRGENARFENVVYVSEGRVPAG
ncbi:MAG: replicative DNA helicase [Defluviitaleaceae bacterium]|nr:replicative DNA helicase [Defluviitaleaceae bacterium]